ncbi:YdeI/OmpD-associated family protein [Fluviicola sp.]|uniref:YdeI/OmpD-associated family protein n=1 Tax=Fluviicola sp. TaxID=1917219 RepID=UPI003D266864
MEQKTESTSFKAVIEIIGINPFVFVPKPILEELFREFGKDKGPIPIKGMINGTDYKQTLVRFNGEWRLYINTIMLPKSPTRIGEEVEISIAIDSSDRTILPHPKLVKALTENPQANEVFVRLIPSLQNEIVRYIANLKTEASVERNVIKAINFLLGKERFIGRDGLK